MTLSPPRILLVHGAWAGPWVFDRLAEELRGRGFLVATVALPTIGSTVDMYADAAAITEKLDAADGPVTLIAHSYGGIPTTQAGDHPAVERIVYVAAFALDAGETLQQAVGGGFPEFWGVADGMVSMGRSRAERIAMVAADLPSDAPADLAAQIADTFQPQSLAAFTTPVTRVAWRAKPTTYVLTERDALVHTPFQEHLVARMGADVVRVPTGHTPFEDDPVWFAGVLADALETAETNR
ncbi:alpha/beta hydrolase [Microbacterium sp.]|uniref:alpha/beta hydrolase n=1 Tax=Microbacterium sp. TaxID=51671 RepID=UPI0025DFC1C8|nr:alpha/beta hydrolase [Microbacterium sp.]MBT9605954.1 alpha/beta hydrolase [Microbacterium sp.]